jgi:hypothetical protein
MPLTSVLARQAPQPADLITLLDLRMMFTMASIYVQGEELY